MKALSYVGCSISRDVTDALPELYYRPQEAAKDKFELRRTVKNFDTHTEFVRNYENPNINLLDAFKAKFRDNLELTFQYVVHYNKLRNRKREESFLHALRVNYLSSFETYNLCWKCRQPIKVKSARIVRPLEGGQPLETAEVKVWNPESKKYEVKRVERPLKSLRRSVSSRDSKLKVWDYEERKYKTVLRNSLTTTFRSSLYSNAKTPITDVYADIEPHFETYTTKAGKLAFALVDGTGILKGVRGQREYFVINDNETQGENLPDYEPPPYYRVFNSKCSCKVR